ncbi:MAG: LPS assembly lipoprotein LptE, partial [Elusimicrobiota bacterium]|nr:LPS assembly lipoprotein LptE [Elusimicrobiota bacterium]
MRKPIFIIIGLGVILLFGCAYTPVEILPQHIKTIAIPTFINRTAHYGIESKLTDAVIEEFIRDGHLSIAKRKEADALLTGEIVTYVLEPLSYDATEVVEQYKLWVIVNLSFRDLAAGEVLWEEKRESIEGNLVGGIEGDVRYYVTPRAGRTVETEEEAQERL